MPIGRQLKPMTDLQQRQLIEIASDPDRGANRSRKSSTIRLATGASA
jgi:hypothetical protein